MDTEPPDSSYTNTIYWASFTLIVHPTGVGIAIGILLLLLLSSALISGSEVALFSLSRTDLDQINATHHKKYHLLRKLLKDPGRLLATILIANNFINIGIVILSDNVIWNIFTNAYFTGIAQQLQGILPIHLSVPFIARAVNFLIAVIGVTSALLLFGEVAPKIYAKANRIAFSKFMARPLWVLSKLLYPLAVIFVGLSDRIEKALEYSRISGTMTTKDDLDTAISLTMDSDDPDNPKVELLKRILKLDEVTAKQIMTPRVDVLTVDVEDTYDKVLQTVKTSGFSRIPVIEEDFDHIKGMLYVKDMLGYLDKPHHFDWHGLINTEVMYVPETKKGNDLLKDFQKKRMHMAIVVDEYGGGTGLVTLEDVMEEVIGEIHDEFDQNDNVEYKKLNAHTYLFEGKTMLNDMARIVDIDIDELDAVRGEADSLAGLILEHTRELPEQGHTLTIAGKYKCTVTNVDDRRIKQVKLVVQNKK